MRRNAVWSESLGSCQAHTFRVTTQYTPVVTVALSHQSGDRSAAGAAQGDLFTEVYESGKS
jgi:hypothetical protein